MPRRWGSAAPIRRGGSTQPLTSSRRPRRNPGGTKCFQNLALEQSRSPRVANQKKEGKPGAARGEPVLRLHLGRSGSTCAFEAPAQGLHCTAHAQGPRAPARPEPLSGPAPTWAPQGGRSPARAKRGTGWAAPPPEWQRDPQARRGDLRLFEGRSEWD